MVNKLYVIDLETTGLVGMPHDKILEICIIELDLDTYQYKVILNEVIKHMIDVNITQSWIVKNGIISLQEIQNGYREERIKEWTKGILNGKSWTSYNTDFDYYKFLKYWDVSPPVFCLMKLATPVLRLKRYHYNAGEFDDPWKFPSLKEAFYWLVYRKKIEQDHRALADTEMATEVAIALDQFNRRKNYLQTMLECRPKKLKIFYHSRKDELTERDILPLKLTDTTIEAYCYLRKEERIFRIDRIKAMGMIES